MNKDEFLRQVGAAINDWDKEKLVDLVNRGIHDGFTPLELTHDVLLPTLQKACRDMDAYNITFPELVLQADTIKAALDVLIPMIKTSFSERKIKGRVVIGTVSGDIHDFGKTLVAAIFESGGYRVVDLGRDVPTEEFIRAAKEEKADVVAASTLMTPTLGNMENLVKEVRARRLGLKTIIGGWATSAEFAKKIGADAWANDPLEGLFKLGNLIQTSRK